MMRGIAGVLALGLLFPGGAAVAAPEVPTVDDAVVAESVDTAPVEAVVESNLDVVESEALDEAPETIATNEASVEPDAELQNDPVVGPLSEQIDTNASVSADSDVVEFKDPAFKRCVADELQRSDPEGTIITKRNLERLVKLHCDSRRIEDITPLRYATGVTELYLRNNAIIDVSPLAGLTSLKYLYLNGNRIVDVSPLAGLASLWSMNLSGNAIIDVSPLAELVNWRLSMDLDGQRIDLADATTGVPFVLPEPRHIDDTNIAVEIDSGPGTLSGDTVTWDLPSGGKGTVSWYEVLTWSGGTAVFSGIMTQNVLPSEPVVDPPIASGTPTISGTAQVGETLTAIPGEWTGGASFAYQWNADDTPIAGATSSSSFTLTAAQAGKAITVSVTGSKSGFTSATETSKPTVKVAPGSLTGATPTISGTTRVGEKLTASAGLWTPSPVTLSYQWQRDGAAIAGATNSEYTLVDADSDTRISVTVTGSKLGYTGEPMTSEPTVPIVGPHLESSTPTISGTARVGEKLTVDPGKWTDGASLAYQWNADGTAIAGATKPTYTLEPAQLGKTITVTVTGSKDGFTSVSKTSNVTAKVKAGKLTAVTPAISGTVRVGQKLTANAGSWEPSPVTLSYQWLRDGVAISSATTSTYTLVNVDMGTKISVKVTGSKSGYASSSKTSVATTTVAGRTLKAATPTISGTAQVAKKLTADPGKWTDGASFTYQWNADGTAIKNATKSTYTLKAAELGKTITVTVTGSKTGYETLPKTSVATTKVLAGTLTTATPTISGTVKVGSTLTASPGVWTSGTVFTYQWLADGKAVKNATKSTYTLKAADLSKAITVKVTGSKAGYESVSKTSAKTSVVAKGTLTTATPKIDGTVKVGSTLTAVAGQWTSGTTFTYRWYSSGKAIRGATAASFVLTADQLGEPITVKVTGSKDGYATVSKTSAKTSVVAKGTLTSVAPTISGTVKVGSTLTVSRGKWTSGTTFKYQWYASGKAIKGATSTTFVLTADQLGEPITVKVTGSKDGYTTVSKTSAKTSVVAKGALTTATPTISGTAKVGSALTAKPGKWTAGTKFTYQWLADGKAIKGATKKTYTLTATEKGKVIAVKVTGTKTGYTTSSKTSKTTGKVTGKP